MRARWVAVAAVAALAVAGCSSAGKSKGTSTTSGGGSATSIKAGSFPQVNQPGVTPTEIRVSGVASVTNPIGGRYDTAFNGVQAYFDMINARGGIYGRKLVLVKRHDDRMTNNKREVEAILDQENVFAVLPVVTNISFSGASLLAQNNVPTFGWGITSEWIGPPSLFPSFGALCNAVTACPSILYPYVTSKLHKHRLAVLAYNVSNSATCVDGIKNSFDKYPVAKVVYSTKALSFGVTDMSADVKRMIDAHVDLVTTCMDNNGVLTLAREMRQQGLDAPLYLPNAYDHDFMNRNGGFFEGSITLSMDAPLETTPRFPALRDYISWMNKAGYAKTEISEIAWAGADLFVTGLRAAGPAFTRQKVSDALNRLNNFDAGGMQTPVDWTKQHTDLHYPRVCGAFTIVRNSKFVPQWGEPGKPFVCWDSPPATVEASKPYARQ